MDKIKKLIFRLLVSIKYYRMQKENKGYIKNYVLQDESCNSDKDFLKINSPQIWLKCFLEYNKYKPKEVKKMVDHLFGNNVYIVKKSYKQMIPQDEPILICNVKNDLERVKMLVNHHKGLGIKYFAFLDNMSTDGTYEWLQSQAFDVFRVEEQYNSVVRSMWITKIASYYGFDRWFITIDSDELLVYDNFENQTIQNAILELKRKGIERGLGFMIDMYAESSDLKGDISERDIYSTYNLFDSEGYSEVAGILGAKIHGGPRERYFGKAALMTKYPLFYWHNGEINRYHYIFPIKNEKNSKCYFGLLHYKFIDGDYNKIKKIVEEGNYASGSSLYKTYLHGINENGKISFYYNGTRKFEKSSDLLNIKILNSLWKK